MCECRCEYRYEHRCNKCVAAVTVGVTGVSMMDVETAVCADMNSGVIGVWQV